MGFATVTAGYWDATSGGHSSSGCGACMETTTVLKPPTILNPGIYAAWNFRSAAQYPAIKADWDGDGTTTCSVFADQAIDCDSDDDGLIEVSYLAQLNAIRYDLDGGGAVADGDAQEYEMAFPAAKGGMGCNEDEATDPEKVCIGCELSAGPDFDGDGVDINGHSGLYWNPGTGWTPIGGNVAPEFEGNGNAISNLFVNATTGSAGLLRSIDTAGKARALGLIDAHVTSTGANPAGGAAGVLGGAARLSHASGGAVTGRGAPIAGGPAGAVKGGVTYSYAALAVTGERSAGGLIGAMLSGGRVADAYATGRGHRQRRRKYRRRRRAGGRRHFDQ